MANECTKARCSPPLAIRTGTSAEMIGQVSLPFAAPAPPEAGAGRSGGARSLGSGGDAALRDLGIPESAYRLDRRQAGPLIGRVGGNVIVFAVREAVRLVELGLE
jgi:hypothetical protein